MINVCLSADIIGYPEGGGHVWAYLNWALALKSCDCSVVWLETVAEHANASTVHEGLARLRSLLAPYGFAERIVLCTTTGVDGADAFDTGTMSLEATAEVDLLLNLHYDLPAPIVQRFRRSALLDIDPGLLQLWIDEKHLKVAAHDVYFTIGERVADRSAGDSSRALPWRHTPPCVALDWWPEVTAPDDAAFTTVTQWMTEDWVGDLYTGYPNSKKFGFLPFLDLPSHSSRPLELATTFGNDDEERKRVEAAGWRIREAQEVSATPWDYQRYIQQSFAEFSCAKPSAVRLQNAWISDRTVCYLASGKPAVVQDTGPSTYLPQRCGLLRFSSLDDAAQCLAEINADYANHASEARRVAEACFDGRSVARRLLDSALA